MCFEWRAIAAHTPIRVAYSGLRLRRRLSGKECICQRRSPWRLRLSPGSGRSAGEGNGTHSSVLAWGTPRSEEPGGLQSALSTSGPLQHHEVRISGGRKRSEPKRNVGRGAVSAGDTPLQRKAAYTTANSVCSSRVGISFNPTSTR